MTPFALLETQRDAPAERGEVDGAAGVGGEFAGGGVALRNAPAIGDAGAEERASGILARGEATDLNSSSIEPQTPRHGDLRRQLGPLLGSSWCLCTSVVHARLSWSLCGFGSLDVLIDSLWPNVKDQPRPSRAVGSSAWLGCIGFPIPNQAKFTAMLSAVPQIKVDQILIRNSGLSRHSFKIINDIILYTNGDGLLLLLDIRITNCI